MTQCCTALGKTQESCDVNEDLEHVRIWLLRNKLHLNMKKTEYITFGGKQRLEKMDDNDFDIQINGTLVRRVRECKHLGVLLDENLTWQNHINTLQNLRKYAVAFLCLNLLEIL